MSELSLELLLLQVVLPALLEQGHTRMWLKGLVRGWTVGVAWLLNLRSYLLGDVPLQDNVSDLLPFRTLITKLEEPTSVARSDVRLTGDQEVAGSMPAGSATFFHGDWSWNSFYGHSLPSPDSRRAVVSFWQKNMHKRPHIRGLSLPSKSVVR